MKYVVPSMDRSKRNISTQLSKAATRPLATWCNLSPGLLRAFFAAARAADAEREASQPVTRSPSQDARDEWLYCECRNYTPYKAIIVQLSKRSEWDQIKTVQGIKDAAKRYARRNNLPPIPLRKRGRPRA